MKKLLFFIILSLSVSVFAQNDFKIKAFHVDNRIQVMPMPELKDLAANLHALGINTIIMEWEGSFPFTENGIISNRYAYTKEEVKDFIRYCEGLDIDVIPLQQCLGHLEYILKFERYASLREDPIEVSQVCPLKKEEVRELYSSLITELIELHPSKYIHIGGDEAYLLGHCSECQAFVNEHGKSELFADYIQMITELVIEKGKIPVLWADIIMKHPEALSKLPEQSVLINWNYGWDINHFGPHENIVNSGLELWGALAIRSWPDNYFLTSWRTHFKNLEDFIPVARESNYAGIVMTSWSTSGLYTYLRETKRHIIEMYAIRHVYPLSGYKMSIEAYAEAIRPEEFNSHDFVTSYAIENFGMESQDAEIFWEGLNVPDETIEGEKTSLNRNLPELYGDTKVFRDFLHKVKVRSNKKEFKHYRLMYDIRTFYIEGKIIQVETEHMDFTPENVSMQLGKLAALKKTGRKLDRKFKRLNKKSLYPACIEEENFLRNREIEILYDQLKKNK